MRIQSLRSFITALLLLVFCIGVQVAWGDTFGRIAGTAKDATGAVIPGVTVTAACVETGIKQTTKTDAQGFYAFPSRAVGHYDVQASQAGFKDFQVTGLTLDVNSALTVDLPLSVGEQS
jgi:Carboxypeptidase regulatory-like domain